MDPLNYFNYYTEIEEYFWQKRGAHLLVSTLDWAVIESWQKAGLPLEVVLKGIGRAFEHYDAKRRGRPVKSLLYCVDAVAQVAEETKEAAAGRGPQGNPPAAGAPFTPGEIVEFLRRNANELRAAARRAELSQPASAGQPPAAPLAQSFNDVAAALDALAAQPRTQRLQGEGGEASSGSGAWVRGQPATDTTANLEDLERHLTVFEEKLLAAMTQAATAEELVELRREVERGLAPYRRRMKTEQLSMIEKQFLQKKLFERHALPRLSLFYLPAAGGYAAGGAPADEK